MGKNLRGGTQAGLVRRPAALTKTDCQALPTGRGALEGRVPGGEARGALPSPMTGSGGKRKRVSLTPRSAAGPWAPLPVRPTLATLLPHQGREGFRAGRPALFTHDQRSLLAAQPLQQREPRGSPAYRQPSVASCLTDKGLG